MTRAILIFLIIVILPLVVAASPVDRLSNSEVEYQRCLDSLSSKVRKEITSESGRVRRSWSARTQKKVESCLAKRRARDDAHDVIKLSKDLKNLYKNDLGIEALAMADEAAEIASLLVDTTTVLNGRYKMANAALWHNFLIWLGAKEGGYCYQWADGLFQAMSDQKYTYFERVWGVHNKGQATENNAVIVIRRGGMLKDGIVYDPWRGKGAPFWRFVSKDSQDWSKLFSEIEILRSRSNFAP